MTDYQNELVMEHLDLVNWVIRTRISVPNRPLLTYDDFYAIGCEAICRAALKYQADSGEFAPFACRYIYNAIIDHCRAMNYRLQRSVDAGFEEGEVLFDLLAHTTVDFEAEVTDDSARVELAEEAKVEDYSLLLISMPKIEQDTEFTPDRLQSALQDNDRTEWVFSRLEEQWKQKYYAVAVSPPEHGTGNLCPISFGKYKGKYSARWIDCAHCHFNVAQPPCCLCVAGAGIQKKEDFKRDLQDRLFDIDKIRRTNEEEIRLREVRERSFERRSVYPRPTPYAARPVVPAGPTQEDLDAEYIRICQSYDPTSDEWTVDRYNRRWIMCTVCGRIKQDSQMSYYGGKGGANRGVCADCSRNGRS